MQDALKLLHAQTTSQGAPFGIPSATLVWLLLFVPLLGSFLQDATKYTLYRLGEGLPARQQRLYRSFRRLHWFELGISVWLFASVFALWFRSNHDPQRAANFAATLQRPTLGAEEMVELESAVLSDSVPLLLQRRFVSKLLNNEISFHLLGGSERAAALRIFGILNAVSMHTNRVFQSDQHDTQIADIWPMVETIFFVGSELYSATAAHCSKEIWSGRKFAFDQAHDVAVRYIPPGSYPELPGQPPLQSLPALYTGNATGRLVVLDGHGFDYAMNAVEKIYFSFAIPAATGANENYLMFIPLSESARRFERWSPEITIVAQGLSGTGIADTETGQIVGIASGVFLMDSVEGTQIKPTSTEFSPCPNGCLTILIFSSSSHVLKLLPDSRRVAGFDPASKAPELLTSTMPPAIAARPELHSPLSAAKKGKPKVR